MSERGGHPSNPGWGVTVDPCYPAMVGETAIAVFLLV